VKPQPPLAALVDGEAFEVRVGANGDVSVSAEGRTETVAVTVHDVPGAASTTHSLRLSPPQATRGASAIAHPIHSQVAFVGDVAWVFLEGEVFEVELTEAEQEPARRRDRSAHDALAAPMPATVIRILVDAGQQVARGDTLLLLEAMKMEMPVKAPHDGRITRVRCRPGELVQPGEPLVELEDSTPR
jgi:biotin carboxyl carrier protein